MVVARLCLDVARRSGVPIVFFVGKFNTTQARCVPMTATRVATRYESNPYMETCLPALSTARGEGLCEREP